MRTHSAAERELMRGEHVAHYIRIDIRGRDGAWRNFAAWRGVNWIEGASWGEDQDQACGTATVELRREADGITLSPLTYEDNAAPVAAGCQIAISTAVAAPGEAPLGWQTVFVGTIDDVDFGGTDSRITVRARDMAGPVIDAQIETVMDPVGLGKTATLAGVLQRLADMTLGYGAVSVSAEQPGPMIASYVQEPKSLLEAMRDLALPAGFDVRYRFTAAGQNKLALVPVNREASTVLATFSPEEYEAVDDAGYSRSAVKNIVAMTYVDASNRTRTVRVYDSASIARYGKRFLGLGGSQPAGIRDSTAAQNAANAALMDMKEPTVSMGLKLLYFWPAQLQDMYTILPDGKHWTAPQTVAVTGYRHDYQNGTIWTTLRTAKRPVAGRLEWLRRATAA